MEDVGTIWDLGVSTNYNYLQGQRCTEFYANLATFLSSLWRVIGSAFALNSAEDVLCSIPQMIIIYAFSELPNDGSNTERRKEWGFIIEV